MNSLIPAARASSIAYCTSGRSTSGRISFGTDFVAGRNRVPKPATGSTALETLTVISSIPQNASANVGCVVTFRPRSASTITAGWEFSNVQSLNAGCPDGQVSGEIQLAQDRLDASNVGGVVELPER